MRCKRAGAQVPASAPEKFSHHRQPETVLLSGDDGQQDRFAAAPASPIRQTFTEPAHDSLQAADGERHAGKVGGIRFPERAELPRRGRQQIQKDGFCRYALCDQAFDMREGCAIVVVECQMGELLDGAWALWFDDFWRRRGAPKRSLE
jgi:hypothetical protein